MTREELYKMLLEYTPIENHFRFMPKEQQQRENLRFLETFQDAACQEISKRPHKEQIMLLYGLRDSRQSGPSPALKGRTTSATVAENVYAEDQGVGKWLVIQRHPRFQHFLEHSHSFLEINYLYSGCCENTVNGNTLFMKQGDFLIMAPGCPHQVRPLGERDLMINLILLPVYAEGVLGRILPANSILSDFLFFSLCSTDSEPNYAFFEMQGWAETEEATADLLREYYDQQQAGSEELIQCRMYQLLLLLWRYQQQHLEKVRYAFYPDSTVASILHYIQENCTHCTRETVARHFSYSPNYLSGLISRKMGKGVIELRNEFRLNLVERKLHASNRSVRSIAEECGFSNMTQFYRLYKRTFGRMPRKGGLFVERGPYFSSL